MSASASPLPRKRATACSQCHVRKVRCDLNLHETTRDCCSNCRDSGTSCVPHSRKRRRVDSDGELPAEVKTTRTPQNSTSHDSPQQASYLGRSDYLTAHVEIDEDDATQYRGLGARAGVLHSFEARIRRSASLLEIPGGTLRQSLLRNFLQRCRPWMPLVSEMDLGKLDAKNADTLLVTSMLVAGSIVSSTPQAPEQGQRCYQRAKLLFYTNAEQNHLHTIMATIFLQWLNPSGPEHVSIDNSSFWLRISVSLAHQMGLHREPDSKMGDAKLRRRIWWALVSRDNQIAASHGRPRAINAEDSNVRALRIDDFEPGDDDAPLFMQFVQITSILGDMTEYYCRGTLSDRKKIDFEEALRRWLKTLPLGLRLYHPETKKLNEYNVKTRQLHVLYFTSLLILFRHDKKTDPPSPVSLLASSFISGIYEEYLTYEDISHLSVTSIFYIMAAALLQLSYHRFPSLSTHRAQELEIIKLSLDGLKKRFPSALGAERVVNQMMKHKPDTEDMPQPTRMSLTDEQKEFFAPFGPELCRKWASVFDDAAEQPRTTTAMLPGGLSGFTIETGNTAIANSNNIANTSDQVNHHRGHVPLTDPVVAQEMDSLWNPSNDSNSADPFFAANDGQFLLNEQDLDSVGRWWWADWVPEADLDFLSKSL